MKYIFRSQHIVILSLASLGLWFFSGQFSNTIADKQIAPKQELVKVQTCQIASKQSQPILAEKAYVKFEHLFKLRPQISGEVVEILVETGDQVEKEALLLKFDQQHYQVALQQAEAQLAAAQLEQQTALSLYEQGLGAHNKLLQSEANLAAVATQHAQARRNLTNRNLYAPISGTIEEINIREYETVTQEPVIIMRSSEPQLYVDLNISQNRLNDFALGQEVTVHNSHHTQSYPATISFISEIVDKATGTINIQAELPEFAELLHNEYVDIEVKQAAVKTFSVPYTAINLDANGKQIIKAVENGLVQQYPIRLLATAADYSQVQLLNADKTTLNLIVYGQHQVANGAQVTIQQECP